MGRGSDPISPYIANSLTLGPGIPRTSGSTAQLYRSGASPEMPVQVPGVDTPLAKIRTEHQLHPDARERHRRLRGF